MSGNKYLQTKIGPILLTTLILSGCQGLRPEPDFKVKIENPTNMPKAKLTNFNEALVCMDTLMAVKHVSPLYITSPGIWNMTSDNSLSKGGKEMLITTINQMTKRSRGVRYVAYGADMPDIMPLQAAHPKSSFRVPDYFFRGGVTQHQKSIWNGQTGAGASAEFTRVVIDDGDGDASSTVDTEDVTGSYSLLAGLGALTMDLSAGYVANLQMIPNAYSANSLAMFTNKGTAITGDLAVNEIGLSYSWSNSYSNDFNDAMRALIQVGTIELVGKLHGLPYWRCLANAGEKEERIFALKSEWGELKKKGQSSVLKTAQKALKDSGYYSGSVDGLETEKFINALQEYQSDMNIMARGVMDFDTFRMMNNYAPALNLPESLWWEGASKGDTTTAAPYGVNSSITVPVN